MGSWGSGPFDSDAACDFLAMLSEGSQVAITNALRKAAGAQPTEYLDVDDGVHAWAAAEIVAGAYGQIDPSAVNDTALQVSISIKPRENDRLLAVAAVEKVLAVGELHDLFHEAEPQLRRDFEHRVLGLLERLRRAADGARPLRKAKRGDLLLLPGANGRALVQVLGAKEVVVFEGTFEADSQIAEKLVPRAAHRVVTSIATLARVSEHLGPTTIRAEHKTKARYVRETGSGPNGGYFENYSVASATGRNLELAGYEEARKYESGEWYDLKDLRELAHSSASKKLVCSPEQREAAFRRAAEPRWAKRRMDSRPGVFGDVQCVCGFLDWMRSTGGVGNMLAVFRSGGFAGALDEKSARYGQIFATIVAWWLGRWTLEPLPRELAARFPEPPNDQALTLAVTDARRIANSLLARDSGLRMIWCGDLQGLKELEDETAELQCALSDVE